VCKISKSCEGNKASMCSMQEHYQYTLYPGGGMNMGPRTSSSLSYYWKRDRGPRASSCQWKYGTEDESGTTRTTQVYASTSSTFRVLYVSVMVRFCTKTRKYLILAPGPSPQALGVGFTLRRWLLYTYICDHMGDCCCCRWAERGWGGRLLCFAGGS
jgi:hypothetical protein